MEDFVVFEINSLRHGSGYVCEGINYDGDGEVVRVEFFGYCAKKLAHEYAAFKNSGSHLEPPMTNARVLDRLGERRDATYTIAETIAVLDAITLCRLQGAR